MKKIASVIICTLLLVATLAVVPVQAAPTYNFNQYDKILEAISLDDPTMTKDTAKANIPVGFTPQQDDLVVYGFSTVGETVKYNVLFYSGTGWLSTTGVLFNDINGRILQDARVFVIGTATTKYVGRTIAYAAAQSFTFADSAMDFNYAKHLDYSSSTFADGALMVYGSPSGTTYNVMKNNAGTWEDQSALSLDEVNNQIESTTQVWVLGTSTPLPVTFSACTTVPIQVLTPERPNMTERGAQECLPATYTPADGDVVIYGTNTLGDTPYNVMEYYSGDWPTSFTLSLENVNERVANGDSVYIFGTYVSQNLSFNQCLGDVASLTPDLTDLTFEAAIISLPDTYTPAEDDIVVYGSITSNEITSYLGMSYDGFVWDKMQPLSLANINAQIGDGKNVFVLGEYTQATHKLANCTATMTGISLDNAGMTFNTAKDLKLEGYTPALNDIIVYGSVESNSATEYFCMKYLNDNWTKLELAPLSSLKSAVAAGSKIYAVGTVTEYKYDFTQCTRTVTALKPAKADMTFGEAVNALPATYSTKDKDIVIYGSETKDGKTVYNAMKLLDGKWTEIDPGTLAELNTAINAGNSRVFIIGTCTLEEKPKTPATGDAGNMMLMLILLAAAAVVAGTTFASCKRR